MPFAKLKASNSTDVMKTEEGNDSLDTIIRQAIGKEPFLSFSRAGDSPVQWIQLLHALDQQELPGWPLLSPIKVQMQKCDKCTREFCSPINHRRHIRAYHRLKKLDKDSTKTRELLAAFWDKLYLEDMKEVVSFKNVTLEEVPGSVIVKNLTALIRKPGFSALPHVYLRAGSSLLDTVQGRPSRFPISSQELFGILDDASEKTFLNGTTVSMQKYVFDGEAAKIGLETKNLIACMSFLVEQKLVNAWLADKDAEALRCQKLLVAEEEAAQKRQAELLERKRQKKLRQKEQKAKEQRDEDVNKEDNEESIDQALETPPSADMSSSSAECHSEMHIPDIPPDHIPPSFEAFQHSNSEEDEDFESQIGLVGGYTDLGMDQNVEQRVAQSRDHKYVVARWKLLPKSRRRLLNGFHSDQNSQASKIGAVQKHATHRQLVNGSKVWSRKPKLGIADDRFKATEEKEAINSADQSKSHEVLIGSISVTLGNCSQEGNDMAFGTVGSLAEYQMPKKSTVEEKSIKSDSMQITSRTTVKLWRPVSRNGIQGAIPVQSCNGGTEVDMITVKGNCEDLPNENCQRSSLEGEYEGIRDNSFLVEGSVPPNDLEFSSDAVKAFLTQRWKEAITANHVELVLSPGTEPPGCLENQNDTEIASQPPNLNTSPTGARGSSAVRCTKAANSRTKPEKGLKRQYIAKQRTATPLR